MTQVSVAVRVSQGGPRQGLDDPAVPRPDASRGSCPSIPSASDPMGGHGPNYGFTGARPASMRTRGCRSTATPRHRWSGRPESNRRRPAWQLPCPMANGCHFLSLPITCRSRNAASLHALTRVVTILGQQLTSGRTPKASTKYHPARVETSIDPGRPPDDTGSSPRRDPTGGGTSADSSCSRHRPCPLTRLTRHKRRKRTKSFPPSFEPVFRP